LAEIISIKCCPCCVSTRFVVSAETCSNAFEGHAADSLPVAVPEGLLPFRCSQTRAKVARFSLPYKTAQLTQVFGKKGVSVNCFKQEEGSS
jgi:hypothetical protein